MILSFHPCIEGDLNITCAGRGPNGKDLKAVQAADAVILPQGCSRELYEMTRSHCRHVFPNYDARFAFPDKIGQIELFRKTGSSYPKTETFRDVFAYMDRYGEMQPLSDFDYPFVFKYSWGGEGESVYLIPSAKRLKLMLQKAKAYEESGLKGFLFQEYVPSAGKTIRVAVIGRKIVSYWRVQPETDEFYSSLSRGAVIDTVSEADRRKSAEQAVEKFCADTGINLAGFDLIFSTLPKCEIDGHTPLFLEINYFFGRKGLGGSEKFYELLGGEVEKWLAELRMSLRT